MKKRFGFCILTLTINPGGNEAKQMVANNFSSADDSPNLLKKNKNW